VVARWRERGIVLVIVLWAIALLTVIALSLTVAQRSEYALTRNQLDGARFRALADAALRLTVLHLLTVPPVDVAPEDLWWPDGRPRLLRFAGEELEIRLFNEASRIDLNSASQEQLLVLLELAGASEELSAALADAIVDWRDPDDLAQLHGAEDDAYRAAGRDYGARDAPFVSVEELRQVLGMTPELYRRLAPDLRVDTDFVSAATSGTQSAAPGRAGSGRFDPTFASAAALAAMQGLPLDNALAAVAERDAAAQAHPNALRRGGPLYRVRVTWRPEGQVGRTLEALLHIAPGARPPFEIRWRREDVWSEQAAETPVFEK